MVDQDFVSGTVISSAWLNGINDSVKDMYGTTAFNLYVAVTGDDTNDGLTALTPFATLQKAIDTFVAMGFVGGLRTINIAAGTYSTAENKNTRFGAESSDSYEFGGVVNSNYIVIQGPDVGYDPLTNPWPTPTAIFDNSVVGGNSAALLVLGRTKLVVRNILFKNYSAGGGIVAVRTDLRCENVHGSGNAYTISMGEGHLEVKGGDIYGGVGGQYIGIRSIFNTKHEIGQQNGPYGQGPRFRFLNQAALVQEGATGHFDYCTFEDCDEGLRITSRSRVNYTGSNFKRCVIGIRADMNSDIFASPGTDEFNDNSANQCTENIIIQTGSQDINRSPYSHTGVATDYLGEDGPVIHTGTGTSTPILSKTLAQGRWIPNQSSIRKTQHIKFWAHGSFSGTAGIKQLKFRIGATNTASVSVGAGITGDWSAHGTIYFVTPTSQFATITVNNHINTTYLNNGTATEDARAGDLVLAFEVQLGNAADTITIEQAHFEEWG